MAMTKCPECKKEVSSGAETCPHCGKVLKIRSGCGGCLLFILGAAVFVVFAVIIFSALGSWSDYQERKEAGEFPSTSIGVTNGNK